MTSLYNKFFEHLCLGEKKTAVGNENKTITFVNEFCHSWISCPVSKIKCRDLCSDLCACTCANYCNKWPKPDDMSWQQGWWNSKNSKSTSDASECPARLTIYRRTCNICFDWLLSTVGTTFGLNRPIRNRLTLYTIGCQRFRPFSDLTPRGFGPEVSALFKFGPHIWKYPFL